MLIVVFVLLSVLLFGTPLYMLVRNEQVYRTRTHLLRLIHTAAGLDIEAGRDWTWRYGAFESVPYGKMVYTFWKNPYKMYDNLDFTKTAWMGSDTSSDVLEC